jgi:rubrerythrin
MGLDMDFAKLKPQDVLDVAYFVEVEAHDRYEELAAEMERRDASETAEFFHAMARREKRHGDRLNPRRRELFGGAPQHVRDVVFWGVEAVPYEVEIGKISVKEALELALSAEIRAHDYYAEAIHYVTDESVERLFEDLRQAELQHQKLIRDELAKLGND